MLRSTVTSDCGSLEQHPLSSSMTSQGTVMSQGTWKTSSRKVGLPVPNLPPNTEQASGLQARLLTSPRQGNSPQAPGEQRVPPFDLYLPMFSHPACALVCARAHMTHSFIIHHPSYEFCK